MLGLRKRRRRLQRAPGSSKIGGICTSQGSDMVWSDTEVQPKVLPYLPVPSLNPCYVSQNLPVSFSTLGLCLLLQRNQHPGNFLGTKLHPLHCCIISIPWYSLAFGHLRSSETSMGPGPFPQGEGERAKHCKHPQKSRWEP